VEASNADNTAVGENSRKVRNSHCISQIPICEKHSRQPRRLDPRRADGDTMESLVPLTARAPSPDGGIATCNAQYM
jgi:hypothetical protein